MRPCPGAETAVRAAEPGNLKITWIHPRGAAGFTASIALAAGVSRPVSESPAQPDSAFSETPDQRSPVPRASAVSTIADSRLG
ncbi:hypothetical protein MINS_20050 [Mycolicibacterium insubricum]|nr:hypothetical protein MINS_20050 [Mycolicibacterium insubricum]